MKNKSNHEKPMTQAAFCRAIGIGYPLYKQLSSEPGFPLVAGRIFWSDFVYWRQKRIEKGLAAGKMPASAESEPLPARPCPRSTFLDSLPPKARRLLENV